MHEPMFLFKFTIQLLYRTCYTLSFLSNPRVVLESCWLFYWYFRFNFYTCTNKCFCELYNRRM